MTHRVRMAKRAETDVEAIYRWIAEHEASPLNAKRWLDASPAPPPLLPRITS